MALIPLLSVGLKGFTAFWSLITWIVAAAFIGQMNDYVGFNITTGNLAGANVLIAAGLLGCIYFGIALFLIFKRPDHILISVLVDTIVLSILFLLALGGTAAVSAEAEGLSDCDLAGCNTGSALIGIGWIFTLLLLGILLFQVVWVLMRRDKTLGTWKTPLLQLVDGRGSGAGEQGIGMSQKRGDGAPAVTEGTV